MEVWLEYLAAKREQIVDGLERNIFRDDEVTRMLAELRVIRDFRGIGQIYIDQGKAAEKQLREEETA